MEREELVKKTRKKMREERAWRCRGEGVDLRGQERRHSRREGQLCQARREVQLNDPNPCSG